MVWDGLDDAKAAVPAGTYYVCIETAVEKGAYSFLREAIKVGGAGYDQALADNGEIIGPRVTHTA